MGRSKQLLPLRGKPILCHCLETILRAGAEETVVVIHPRNEAAARLVEKYPVRLVYNDRADLDMTGSVLAGLMAVAPETSGVLVCLADHPLVHPRTMYRLCSRHRLSPDKILIPVHNNRRGHPTLFPREIIAQLTEQQTLRDLIKRHFALVTLVEVKDPGIYQDVDTPADYEDLGGKADFEGVDVCS